MRGLRIFLTVACVGALGCGSSGKSGGNDTFSIFPPNIYTGYDGTNVFKAPIIAHAAPGAVTWTVADPSLVTLTPSSDGAELMIEAKKAGETTVTAMSGGKTVTAPLKIYAYTADQHTAGVKRYTTAVDDKNPPCTACHGAGKGPDHTPTELDADPDDEVINTFLTGKDPEGRVVGEDFPELLKDKGFTHMWKVTEDEKTALVSYMRSLAPSGFPEYDAPTAGR
ncbi:MAG TPA: Ig-like domain-containing protein [Polyangia bacterium]|jgi:hypothetical protein|nr:Ig-like domain-containing protein [Polyangia bacterium]